jgi:hypothetical protein
VQKTQKEVMFNMGTDYGPDRPALQPPPQGWGPQGNPYYQQQQPPPPGYGYPPPQPPWQGQPPRGNPPPQPQKWYKTNVGIIAPLIIFFPVGLYLMWRYANWPKNAKLIVTGILAVCVLISGIANAISPPQQGSQAAIPTQQTSQVAAPTQQPAVASTQATIPTAAPTPQPAHYPPTTGADLHGLAAEGDVSVIHEFHSESVGMTGACPQPKREVTVDPSITGKQLAEDLLAYFYGQQLDNPCGSIVFAYHTQAEVNDPNSTGYTAGRINFDVTDSSGSPNVDPNASNLKYTLTLDVGDSLTGQEYVVTY